MEKKRVLVQMGHVAPRDPNHERETGANGEIELVSKIGPLLRNLLLADGRFEVLLVPGRIPPSPQVDAAIFLHGDGAGNSAASGYSFGFPNFAVNKKLADLIHAEFQKLPGHLPHHRDNYTDDLEGYYGFGRVPTSGPEVVVEHGFLSNPAERKWMFDNVGALARAEYKALCRFFGFVPVDEQKPPVSDRVEYDVTVVEADGSVSRLKTKFPGVSAYRVFVSRRGKRRPRSVVFRRAE